MKKSLLLIGLLGLFLVPRGVGAKSYEAELFNWGGSSSDSFSDVIPTSDGGYVTVGSTNSTDIVGITNRGNTDALIVKYDKDGNIEWQKNYGGSNSEYFNSVIVTSDGGYVVVGNTKSSDIDGITYKGNQDCIIVKYDKEGNVVWQKNYGGSNYDSFLDVTLVGDGGYVVVGSTYSTDIEGIYDKEKDDAIIVKYDINGNIEWQKNYGGDLGDYFRGVTATSDGGCVVVGYTYSRYIDGVSLSGNHNTIIVKYDKNGNIKWRNYTFIDKIYHEVIETLDGSFVAVGVNENSSDGSDGNSDGIIAKYNNKGNLLWYETYEITNYYNSFGGVTVSSDGEYMVVGVTDLDGPVSSDAIVIGYDKDGNIMMQKNYGGSNSDSFSNVVSTEDGGYIIVGSTNSTDIDGVPVKGSSDAFIAKLSVLFDITSEETINGTFEVVNEDNKGKITISPDEGYELDEIIITDSKGNEVDYIEKDGYYYFDLTDDVNVKVKFKEIEHIITLEETKNGYIEAVKENEQGVLTLTPDDGYGVDKIIITDSSGNDVRYVEEDGNYYFDLTDDVTVMVTFKRVFTITSEETVNGTFEAIKEDDQGVISVVPEEGYKIDEITITDSNGKRIEYTEKDGVYYFHLVDDVVVNVTFKKENILDIVNPDTGIMQVLDVLFVVALVSGSCVFYVLRKKNYI